MEGEMTELLISPNPRHTYLAGNEFGALFWIAGESYEDAWAEFLCALGDAYVCDHGLFEHDNADEFTRLLLNGQESCDCEPDDNGRFINTIYLWMRESQLPVDKFFQAFEVEL